MIEIIVPIYEGLEETKQCINSILNAKSKEKYQVILINDNSPNTKMHKLLE
ncbi:glycosyl transferase family 2, partial [Terribacillus saccharophilus]